MRELSRKEFDRLNSILQKHLNTHNYNKDFAFLEISSLGTEFVVPAGAILHYPSPKGIFLPYDNNTYYYQFKKKDSLGVDLETDFNYIYGSSLVLKETKKLLNYPILHRIPKPIPGFKYELRRYDTFHFSYYCNGLLVGYAPFNLISFSGHAKVWTNPFTHTHPVEEYVPNLKRIFSKVAINAPFLKRKMKNKLKVGDIVLCKKSYYPRIIKNETTLKIESIYNFKDRYNLVEVLDTNKKKHQIRLNDLRKLKNEKNNGIRNP